MLRAGTVLNRPRGFIAARRLQSMHPDAIRLVPSSRRVDAHRRGGNQAACRSSLEISDRVDLREAEVPMPRSAKLREELRQTRSTIRDERAKRR